MVQVVTCFTFKYGDIILASNFQQITLFLFLDFKMDENVAISEKTKLRHSFFNV